MPFFDEKRQVKFKRYVQNGPDTFLSYPGK